MAKANKMVSAKRDGGMGPCFSDAFGLLPVPYQSLDAKGRIIAAVKAAFKKHDGYAILESLGGKECIDLAGKEQPDLVLLDIMMPDMSGRDVFMEVHPKQPNLKIIFLSALNPTQDIQKLQAETGVKYNLTKPFNNDVLVDIVKKTIGGP